MTEISLVFIKILMAGGWLIVPIVICSLVAGAIILERAWFYFRMPALKHADHMIMLVSQGKFTEGLSLAEGKNAHPVLRVLAAGIITRNAIPEKAMESAGMAEVQHMNRGLPALDTIITLSPLLGLLGTIIGMIDSFGVMAVEGIGQPHAVTGGVAEALICTAAGILVAVTTLVPYNYFVARSQRMAEHIENYATQTESALKAGVATASAEAPS